MLFYRLFAFAILPIWASTTHADRLYQDLRDEAWKESPATSDAQVATDSLDLKWLISEVQSRNPSTEIALNTWRAALAEYPQAKSLEDPMIGYVLAPRALERGSDVDNGHRVEASQQFPWPGKRRLRGERALAAADARHVDIETVRAELAREARVVFYEYWYVHRALEINAVNAALLEEYLDLAESNYAAGTTSRQDALQAEVEREHIEHGAIVLRRMANVARARINTLMLRDPQSPVPPPPATLPLPYPSPDPQRLQQAAVKQRPELKSLVFAIDADALGVEIARKEFYPDFTVFAAYDGLWQEDELRPMVGASLNLPIRLGRRRAAVEQARAEQLRTQSELERERNRIAYEVQQTYEILIESEHVVRLYEDRLLSIAEENLKAAESNYYSVDGTFLALITAQKQQMDTQLAAYAALATYHQSLADLERAVGGPIALVPTGSGVDE